MTPTSPSNSGGQSLPPRKPMGQPSPSGDASESDLWDLDDTLESAPEPPPAPEPEPALSEPEPPPAEEKSPPTPAKIAPAPRGGSVPKREKPGPSKQPIRKMEDAFEDLEDPGDWDQPEPPPASEDGVKTKESPAAISPEPAPAEEAAPAVDEETSAEAPKPDAAPSPPRVTALSKLELIGLGLLLAMLLGVGIFFYAQSLNRLPKDNIYASEADFPIRGDKVEVVKAESYWRAPVTDGPQADVVRRGTRLIPVIELQVKGRGAVRVFFRDDMGELVGDGVSLPITGDGQLKVAATAGFDDLGLYAAYRAGEGKPWTIEVFEASSVNAMSSELKKLFKMSLSSVRK